MKKYLLPTALILALATVGALAQTFVRAIQLSQDTTGAFSVDSNNGVYFPGHILTTTTLAPTVSGTGSPTITGTDFAATITMGTSATTATAVFGQAYLAVPTCVAASQTTLATPITFTPVTTSIAFTQITTSGNKVSYICTGAK